MPSVAPGGRAAESARSGRGHVRCAAAKIASTWAGEPRERMCSRTAATALRRTPRRGRSGSRDWSNTYSRTNSGGGERATARASVRGARTPVRAGKPPYGSPRKAPERPESATVGPIVHRAPPMLPLPTTRRLAALWRAPSVLLTQRPASRRHVAPVAHDGCGRTDGSFPWIRTRRRGDGRRSGTSGARATRFLRRCGGLRGKMAEARWSRALLRLGTGWLAIPSPRAFNSSTSRRTASRVETAAAWTSDRTGQSAAAWC